MSRADTDQDITIFDIPLMKRCWVAHADDPIDLSYLAGPADA